MKRMPNITFSRESLEEITYTERFSKGGEAIICLSNKPNSLYKIFINPYTGEIIDMSDNKFKKIATIYQMGLDYSVRPLSTISMDGRLVGYEMSCNPLHVSMNEISLTPQQLIEILKRTKDALEYFESKDITYGDVKNNNILINRHTGQIEFCDMDNIRLGENPIDLMGKDLRQYVAKNGVLANADAYMHNLFALKELGFPTKYTTSEGVIMTLEKGEYPTEFEKFAHPIFEGMVNPESFNGEYAIQYIKKGR